MKNKTKTSRYMINGFNQAEGRLAHKNFPFLFMRDSYTWDQIFKYAVNMHGAVKSEVGVNRWLKNNGMYITEDVEW